MELTFTGLDSQEYWAVAEVGGTHLYISFYAGSDEAESAAAVTQDDLDARVNKPFFIGSEEEVQPLIDALPEGTEYHWDLTPGTGVLLDIKTDKTGVSA
jgi:hypothetical protein